MYSVALLNCVPIGMIQSASLAHSLQTTQEISCCGLALSPDMSRVAVGDMVGNVWIYHLKETEPTHHHNVSYIFCL